MSGKTIRVLGIIAAALAVVCIALVVTLKIMFPPERIKGMVIPQVEKALGRTVVVDKAGISVFPSIGVDLKGLSIAETRRAGFDSTAFLRVGEVEVRIGVMALLRRSVDITKIRIYRPYVRVEVDTSGAFNYDDMAMLAKKEEAPKKEEPAGIGLPLPLSLRSLTIVDGAVEYVNQKSGQIISIGSINEQLSMSTDKKMENVVSTGEILLGNITIKTGESAKPIQDLTFTLRHDVAVNLALGTASIKTLRLSLQEVYVNLAGTVTDLVSSPRYDLTMTTDTLSIEKLISAVSPGLVPALNGAKGSGALFLKVAARGGTDSTNPPVVDGRLSVLNGGIQYPGLPESIHDMRANISFTTDKVVIAPLMLKLGANPIELTCTVENFAKPLIDATLNAKINLGDLKNIIKMAPGNTLGGLIGAQITAKGRFDPARPSDLDKMRVDGFVNLKDVIMATPAVAKPVAVNGVVNLSSAAIGTNLNIAAGKSAMAFKAQLNNYLPMLIPSPGQKGARAKLAFTLSSPLLDVSEILPPAAADSKKTAPASVPAQSQALLFPSPLPGIDVTGNISGDRLRYKDIEISGFETKISSVNDILNIDLKAGMLGGALAHSLSVNAQNNANLAVKSVLGVNGVEMSQFITAVKSAIPPTMPLRNQIRNLDKSLFGKAIIKSEIKTTGGTATALGDNVNGVVSLKLADGRIAKGELLSSVSNVVSKFYTLNDIQFKDMSAAVTIRDKKAVIDDMSVNSPIGAFKASGSVGFDGNMDIGLADKLSQNLSRPILALQNKGKEALGGLLGGTPLAGASDLITRGGIPADKDNRVTLLLGIGGKPGKYKTSFKGFGSADAVPSSGSAGSPVKDALAQKKQEAAQLIEQEKKRLAEEAAKKAAELEAKAKKATGLNVPTPAAADELKKKAAERLRKVF